MRKFAVLFATMLCLSSMIGLAANVSAVTPPVYFSADIVVGPAPLTVNFSGATSGNVTMWIWDFNNDGVTDATTQNATYVYSTAGTYSVSLTVIYSGGASAGVTKTDYILATGAGSGASSWSAMIGKYDDGTTWDQTNASSMTVNTSKYISNATGFFQWVLADPGLPSGTFAFYINLVWEFNGKTLANYLIGSDKTDNERVAQFGIGGMITDGNTTYATNALSLRFSEGDGNYTLTAIMQIYTSTGYTQSAKCIATFDCIIPGLLPTPHISSLFIQIAGIVGVLSMILAIPMFFWMTGKYNWLFGLSTMTIMGLIGFVLFNVFVLNSGSI